MLALFGKSSEDSVTIGMVTDVMQQSLLSMTTDGTSGSSASQSIDVDSGDASDNTQTMSVTNSLTAIYKAVQKSDMTSKINNKMQQEMKKKLDSLFSNIGRALSGNDTKIDSDIGNKISNLHATTMVSHCISDIDAQQNILVKSGRATRNRQSMTVNNVVSCATSSESSMNVISDIVNTGNQSADIQEDSPFKPFTDMIAHIGDTFMSTIMTTMILLGAGAAAFYGIPKLQKLNEKKKEKEKDKDSNIQYVDRERIRPSSSTNNKNQ